MYVVAVVFLGGCCFTKKIAKQRKILLLLIKTSFFRVDFGQGLALNQVTGPVNLVPEKKN
jgi:hypothetical protein